MEIQKLVVGQLQTNCYLVSDGETEETAIIDPGDEADYIHQIILRKNLTPTKIIATHGHFDHLLAVMELKLAYNIPFLMHKEDEFLLKRMRSSAKRFTGLDAGLPPRVDKHLTGVTPVSVGKSVFGIIETPGHTPGSVCLYCKKEKTLLVGDLVFAEGGWGRTDFVYSRQNDLKKSIAKLLKLPPETKVYSGHGESTSIGEMKNYFAHHVKI